MPWNATLIKLKEVLAGLYTEEARYRVVVRESELKEENIQFTGTASTDWSNILTEADKQNKVLEVINRVRKDYEDNEAFCEVAEQYIQNVAKQRDMRPIPKALSPEIIAIYNNYVDMLQAKDEVTRWYATSTRAEIALTDQSGISPESIDQVQQSLRQLNNLVKEEYRLLEKDSDLREFFGQDCYDLMKMLSSVDEQSGDLIIKMQLFKSIYDPGSMISLEWQQDIQQNMLDILQKLQEIDDLVQPPQTQSALKGGTKVIEVIDVYQVPSLPADTDQPKMSVQSAETTGLSKSEVLSKVDEIKLSEAMFRFYKMDELISLCSDLSTRFADPDMEYEKLSGRTAKSKLTTLIKRFQVHGIYENLLQYLVQTPHFEDVLRQVLQEL